MIVAGASGSGKSTFAHMLQQFGQPGESVIISLDRYYRNQAHRTAEERAALDYDCWEILDGERLVEDVRLLKAATSPVSVPNYDFSTHSRTAESDLISPATLTVVEGILALHDPRLRSLADDSVFLDIDQDLCFQRRLHRDIRERGRTPESVRAQWAATVAPNYERFVLPSRQHAKRVITRQSEEAYRAVIEDIFRAKSAQRN